MVSRNSRPSRIGKHPSTSWKTKKNEKRFLTPFNVTTTLVIDEPFLRLVWNKAVDRFVETNRAFSPAKLINGDFADRILVGGRVVAGFATGGAVAETFGSITIIEYLKGKL